MPVVAADPTARRLEVLRHEPPTGRWVRLVADADRVRIEIGTTGNRLDPQRRVRLSGHDLLVAGGRAELRSWWPVPEVVTHRVGQFVADLRGELAAAGSPDPGSDLAALAGTVREILPEDVAVVGDDIVAAVLASSYPLLRTPLAAGARPEVVPLALEPMLHHPDPRSAARDTLGPRVTRPLVRALAGALTPDDRGELVWEPVLCALMAAMRCGPEQLTAILVTPVHRPGAIRFTLAEVDRARTMFADVHPRRVSERLRSALADPGGTAALQTAINAWNALPPAPVALAPTAPPPPRPPVVAAPRPDPALVPLDHPPAWRAVAGREVAGHRVVLPRTADELVEWGAAMDNCLGAYRNAAAVGRTRILGLARDGRLAMAVEISRSRVLRQLETRGNTVPDEATARRVVTFLRQHDLIDADARRAH